jgi:hypothetical protein
MSSGKAPFSKTPPSKSTTLQLDGSKSGACGGQQAPSPSNSLPKKGVSVTQNQSNESESGEKKEFTHSGLLSKAVHTKQVVKVTRPEKISAEAKQDEQQAPAPPKKGVNESESDKKKESTHPGQQPPLASKVTSTKQSVKITQSVNVSPEAEQEKKATDRGDGSKESQFVDTTKWTSLGTRPKAKYLNPKPCVETKDGRVVWYTVVLVHL